MCVAVAAHEEHVHARANAPISGQGSHTMCLETEALRLAVAEHEDHADKRGRPDSK